jgi:cyanate permease
MWLLAGMLFIGIGIFNVVATWLDAILTHFGHGGASGYLIALMTVGGIAGAAVLPGLAARREQRRTILQVAVVVTAVAFVVIAVAHSPVAGGVALFVAGFFLLAGLPVVLDWSELHAGPERAASAAGFLLLAGNLGGVVLVLIVQAVIGNPYLSLGVLSVAGLAGLALAFRLPARGVGRPDAAQEGASR